MTQYVTCERCGTMWEFMQHYVGPQQCPTCAAEGRGWRRAGTGVGVPSYPIATPNGTLVEDILALGRERDALRARVAELEKRIKELEAKP